MMADISGRRSSEKVVGRWALVEGEIESGEGALPLPVLGVQGCYPRKNFENVGTNLCNLVHFVDIWSSKVGRKIDAFWGWNLPSLPYRFCGPWLIS